MKDLLSQLAHIESLLNEFSFEELGSSEANQLKTSFSAFKTQVQEKILGGVEMPTENVNGVEGRAENNGQEHQRTVSKEAEASLIANVSHEIRTPLNGIIGFTDLLKEDALSEIQLERVNAIETASYSLMEIINELLEFSKLSAGLEQFESINFSFHGLIRDILYLCNTLIIQKNVTLEVDMDSAIPEVLVGDPAKLSQVLLNLLGNAIKFVEEGEIALKILLKKEKDDRLLLEFIVADNGIGIDEAQLPYIFDSFRQAEHNTADKYGGSGLGLSIVKQIILNLGGDISVSSNLGQGTTFKFVLPFSVGNKAKLPRKNQDKNHLKEGAKLLKGMGILVFEDNLLNQRLIEQRLKVWGCKTFVTDNCQYGLNILNNHSIDIVLMDLRMPGMSGFEVTERIRNVKNETVSGVPIIALTADFTIQDREKSDLHGINDYILKPYSPDELLLKLVKNKKNMKKIEGDEAITLTTRFEEVAKPQEIQLKSVLDDCMGQIDLLEELVQLYKQNALEFIGAAKTHLKNRDFSELEFVLHKIKAGLSMMQTDSLYSIVVQMQNCSKQDKDVKHLEFLYGCFLEEYPKVESMIDQAVARLKKDK